MANSKMELNKKEWNKVSSIANQKEADNGHEAKGLKPTALMNNGPFKIR